MSSGSALHFSPALREAIMPLAATSESRLYASASAKCRNPVRTDDKTQSIHLESMLRQTTDYIFWPYSANSVVSLNMWFQMWPAQLRFRNRSDSPSVMRCLWEYCAARDFSRLWSGPVSTAEFSNHVNICITALKNSDEKPTSWDTNR